MKTLFSFAWAMLIWAGSVHLYACENHLLPDEYTDIVTKSLLPEKGQLVRGINIGMTLSQVRNIEKASLLQDTAAGYITYTFYFNDRLSEFADVKYYYNATTNKVTGIAFDFYLDTKDRSDILMAEFTKFYSSKYGTSKKGIIGEKMWSFNQMDAMGASSMVDIEITDLSTGELGGVGVDYYGYSRSTAPDEDNSDPSSWQPLDDNLQPMDYDKLVADILAISGKSVFRNAYWAMTMDEVRKNEAETKLHSETETMLKYTMSLSPSYTEFVDVVYYFDDKGICTGWGLQLFLGSYERSEKLKAAFIKVYDKAYESTTPILGDYMWTLTTKSKDKTDAKVDIELDDKSRSGDYGFNIDYYKSVM